MRYLLVSLFLLTTAVTAYGADFRGEWRVDEEATLAQMESDPMRAAQMARELPVLIEQMRPIAYRFEEKHLVAFLGERSESARWHMLDEDSSTFHVLTQLHGERTEVRIDMLSLNQMRMASERDDELGYLIWRRVDHEGVSVAMR